MRRLAALALLLLFSPFAANAQLITGPGSSRGGGGGGGSTSPGGSSGAVQYNNAGSFGGFGSWSGSTLSISNLTVAQNVGSFGMPGGGSNPYGSGFLASGTMATQTTGGAYGAFSGLLTVDASINLAADDAAYNVYVPILSIATVPASATKAVFELGGIYSFAQYSGSAVNNNPIITGLVGWVENTTSIAPFGILQGVYSEVDARADAFKLVAGTFTADTYNSATSSLINGLDVYFNVNDSSVVTDGIGVKIRTSTRAGGATLTTNYGLKIEDQTAGTTNYSIFTGLGQVRLGGVLNLAASGMQVNGVPGISRDVALCTGVGCATTCVLRIASGVITNATGTCPAS